MRLFSAVEVRIELRPARGLLDTPKEGGVFSGLLLAGFIQKKLLIKKKK